MLLAQKIEKLQRALANRLVDHLIDTAFTETIVKNVNNNETEL